MGQRKKVELVGGAYKDRSLKLNAQECLNLFARFDPSGKYIESLLGTPGLVEWADSGEVSPVRGLHRRKDGTLLYAAIGSNFYQFDTAGTPTDIGNLDTSSGPVKFEEGYTHVMAIDGTSGYYKVKTTGDFAKITDVDFPTPKSLTYQDGYYIVIEAGTDIIVISANNDPTAWDALDYASAESSPDDALTVISDRRELFIFGSESSQVFYNSGNADFPFTQTPGGVVEVGIGAEASAVKLDNSIFWLDDHFIVRKVENYQPIIVSTRAIDKAVAGYTAPQNAIGYGYLQEGHSFYVLTFPDDDITWVYDASSSLWHRRGSWPIVSGLPGRHRSNCYAWFNNLHLVGDFENGKIYKMDLDTYDEDGNELVALRTFRSIHAERRRMFFDSLEIDLESGVGTGAGDGLDPQIILRWSDDGARTWSDESWATHSVDIGEVGSYKTRVIWRKLGQSYDRVFSVKITDPVKRVLMAAFIEFDLEVTGHESNNISQNQGF